MIFLMKLWLRVLAWSALDFTGRWLGLEEISRAVSENRLDDARRLIESGRRTWGDDPEFVRAETLVSFLEGEE